MTWGFRNGITLGIWTQKCPCNCRLNFIFQNSQICPLKALGQKYGKIWGFLGSRTPQMGIYHLVRTIRMGKNQKKRKKNLHFLQSSQSYGGWKTKVSKKGLNFKKSTPRPPKINLFRTKTISRTYLGINVEVYDPKVQIWRGGKKDKLT